MGALGSLSYPAAWLPTQRQVWRGASHERSPCNDGWRNRTLAWRRRPRGGTKPGLCESPLPYQLITQTARFWAEDGGGEHILSSRSNKVTCSLSIQARCVFARWIGSAFHPLPVAPPPCWGGNYIDFIQHLTLSLLESHHNYLRYFPSYQSRGPIAGV